MSRNANIAAGVPPLDIYRAALYKPRPKLESMMDMKDIA